MDENILVYNNVISSELSDTIIDYSEKFGNWQGSEFISNNTTKLNKLFRTSSEIWVERTKNLENIRDIIEPTLRNYIDKHPLSKIVDEYILYEMRVLRYDVGQFLKMHSDNPKLLKYSEDKTNGIRDHLVKNADYRWLTVCLYLSNFIGGELNINNNFIIKPEKDSLILFPGVLKQYSHESFPVKTGTKYVLTTWACSKK